MVAGMCVMQDGIIKKNLSRRFKIKTVFSQDDPACMKEVVKRRLLHSLDNKNNSFGTLPNAIFADGGITQIRAIKSAIAETINDRKDKENELKKIVVFGMVKNEKHQTRALMDENRKEIKISEELFNLITNFQDSVHDNAIGYHRMIREKELVHSELDDIQGIGEVKKKALLKKFGSVKRIKEANIEELTEVKGITKELAEKIKKI